ncbi:ABCB family ABC transporter ATP-binding protein/permease [Ampullimonas aquatilis]|uniref:ABCB family ABC transporter ATP-binding protein/permease n=1 Tax=Ampullimonas aquatilis TaxID=1341549 RepID=UPI003C7528C5
MRRHSSLSLPPTSVSGVASLPRNDWQTIRSLLPYLLKYKLRVALALICLVLAKVANIGVPLVLKQLVDGLSITPEHPRAMLVLPIATLIAYGLLRLSTSLLTELRELLFSKVTESAVREISLNVFRHLHALSLRFHLERQTGGMTRDIERGTRGISSLISYSLYSIVPTLVEVGLVLGYLLTKYDYWFGVITIIALATYIVFTVSVTEWRMHFRRTLNEMDSKANTRAIDSLLNYETVKYFNNEEYEARRYDEGLRNLRKAAIKSQQSLSFLNVGQQVIIATALILILWRATAGVVDGSMSLGDLVLINAFMIQLYIPLNFLGVIYREIKQSLADLERMFKLLSVHREVVDLSSALPLRLLDVAHGPRIEFDQVNFAYDMHAAPGVAPGMKRQILHDVSFVIAPGTTTAVVGTSGAGKSTLARLLFRFYDVQSGTVRIDGQDIRQITQTSVRSAIGIVPQDTVLFNDTIFYNIAYGRPGAAPEEIEAAARAAYIHDFIVSLPEGYNSMVGERGLKLSGGEKQRVAIARTILKNPAILIFDEATSALDSRSEQAIQTQLKAIAKDRTTLVIAHRLSTIVDAQQILVMEHGRIVERGTHQELLDQAGVYSQMWARQQSSSSKNDTE